MHRTTHRARGATVLATVAALLTAPGLEPPEASAERPKVALAGISFGMTPAQVRAALGTPRRVTRQRPQGTLYRVVWHYRDRLTVEFAPYGSGRRKGKPRIVASVTTRSPQDLVRPGIGVGSKLSAVRRLRPLSCGDYGRGDYLCLWSVTRANDPCGPLVEFLFHDKRGRVVEVALQAETFEGCDRP